MASPVEVPVMGSPVSERIVETVAVREGVDPVDLQPPLYETIDTEALDALFAAADGEVRSLVVEFTYCGHEVRVTPDDVAVLGDV